MTIANKLKYLELRHQTYYATLKVPKDVRHIIGTFKFYQSTKTGDLRKAQERAAALVLAWKLQISQARHQAEDPIVASALDLRRLLITGESPRHLVEDVVQDEQSRVFFERGEEHAEIFQDIVAGEQKPLSSYVDSFEQHETVRSLKKKTIDRARLDIEILVKTFPTANSLKPDYVEGWIKSLQDSDNLSASTCNRIMGNCRGFFRYLQSIKVISKTTATPFLSLEEHRISNKRNTKAQNRSKSYLPFKVSDVEKIHREAKAKNDQTLADLIIIGAYTGARIEEICSLKISNIDLDEDFLTVEDAKTEAGNRLVPIHTKLKPLIVRLKDNSTNVYLLSELTFNKYGDRSNAVGKRFGRLKIKMKYSDLYVFHSIRKTVITLLENNGVSENLAADIVGHEKPRITYGLYSGGAILSVKRLALEGISFDFDK